MKNITYEILELLIKQYGNIENLWNIDKRELCKNQYLSEKVIFDLINVNYKKDLNKYLNDTISNNINVVSYKDFRYPKKLNYITNKPIVLYMKGNLSTINNNAIAIVGSRECSFYGRKNAMFFSYELAKKNISIISGLAKGIDTASHLGAIKAKGNTIAVVGSGINIVYPKENEYLYNEILTNNGLIISEYLIGTPPNKENFPRRNRIISGLSDGVIVIEASEKSGALITADYAINQGKEVWAMPGNINSYNSVGTNQLIKDGANVITNLNDIIN